MLMLDLLAGDDAVVAHFDHGTRDTSSIDAEFVRSECEKRGMEFITERAELGEGVSEETARKARYDFLFEVCNRFSDAELYTAHHLDDLAETIAINLLRGTGWRGMAVLDSPRVRRPFLESEFTGEHMGAEFDKKAIFIKLAERSITFREDPTNSSDEYLRNRIRHQMNNFLEKRALLALWQKQKELKREIDSDIEELLPEVGGLWERNWFRELDEKVALEMLRAGTLRIGIRATRPQLENFRRAILEYAPGTFFNLPKDKLVKFTKDSFEL